MPEKKSGRKTKIFHLLAWIVIFPFLIAWPFLSAFPALSLIGSSTFDLSVSLNVIFLFTGFWVLAGAFVIIWWLTNGKVRSMYGANKGLLVGAYATVWTGLYVIASMANR